MRTVRGIAAMIAAAFLFSILNALVKILSARYPVTEIAFFRNAGALFPIAALVLAHGWRGAVATRHLTGHLCRATLGLGTMLLLFWACALLPLADATALWFSGPLFLTALSWPLLGERVDAARWGAVLVGFLGVLIMIRPSGDLLKAGTVVCLAASVGYGLTMTHVRRLSRTESAITIVFYFTVFSTILTALTLPFAWATPDWLDLGLLLLCGLVGGCAQMFLTHAYGAAPAAVIAPFSYTALVWSVLLGYGLWGEVPDTLLLLGAVVVAGSGLQIIRREASGPR